MSGLLRTRVADWLACLTLIGASLAMALVHVPQHATVSPIDEYVYIDYLAKVPTQGVVHRGEETGDYARNYLACHGVRVVGTYPEEMCQRSDTSLDEERYPNAGATSADLYTPLYFATTWVLAQPLVWAGVDDITEAGRYTGWIWLAGAAVALYFVLRRMSLGRVAATAGPLLMIGSLASYWSNTYISTDATSLTAGAALLLVGLRVDRGLTSPWWLVLLSVVATMAKFQNFSAVVLVSLFLLIRALNNARTQSGFNNRAMAVLRSSHGLAAVGATFASAAAQLAWFAIRSATAVGPQPDQDVSAPLGKKELVNEAFKFLPGVAQGAIDPHAVGYGATVMAAALSLVLVAGVVGLALSSARGSTEGSLAVSALVCALVAGPALAIANFLFAGFYFVLPSRYGMAMLPAFLATSAILFAQKRWGTASFALVAAGSYVLLLTIIE